MEFTGNSKLATAGAAGALTAGFAVIAYSAHHKHVAGSIGGACLVISALTCITLVLIRHWVANTSEERRILGAATRAAQDEQTRYIAAQAALENEMGRLTRDIAADRARVAGQLIAERQKMAAEFEGKRATLAAEAFRTGVEMERAGMLKADARPPGNLIQFPGQGQPERSVQRERSREHGVVGP